MSLVSNRVSKSHNTEHRPYGQAYSWEKNISQTLFLVARTLVSTIITM